MNCFIQKDVQNPKFPVFSKRIQYLKKDEGGVSIMCEVMGVTPERVEKIRKTMEDNLQS